MLKFNLTVNEQHVDGFKLITQADTQEEINTLKELADKLINKISKIEVSVSNYDN